MPAILVIENDDLELEFIRSVIHEAIGRTYSTLIARSGAQAVRAARQNRPELILLDVLLPDMDGIDAVQEIRRFLPGSCISILTASTDFYRAQKAIRLRVHDYMLKPIKPKELKAALERMAELAEGETAASRRESALPPEPEGGGEPLFIREAMRYIHAHFEEKLNLGDVAKRVYINSQYFSRVFKRETGLTFTEYLNHLRIQAACRLLASTSYPAYRVANECGFSDPSYFNRVFLRYMEMTPQTYRRLHRDSGEWEEPSPSGGEDSDKKVQGGAEKYNRDLQGPEIVP